MSSDKGVAVVLLNYNKRKELLLALKSVYASDYPDVSVVVVDNNSSDGSADAVAQNYPETPLIRNPENTGVAKGRNLGWRYADKNFDFEYVIFLDDDSEVAPDYFSKVVKVCQSHPDVGIVTGKAYIGWDTNVLCSVGQSINLYTGLVYDIGAGKRDRGQYNTACYRAGCSGFAYFVRRRLFEQLGGFDEHFSPYGWEDADFCLRAKKQGYKTYYLPDAVVIHKGTKAARDPIAGYERSKIKNYFYLLRQHTTLLQKCCCAVCIPVKGLYIIGEMVLKGHAGVIFSQLRGFFEGLLNKK